MKAHPVVRIRGSLHPKDVAKLIAKGRQPRLDELLRLFKDKYNYSHLDLEVEIDLDPDSPGLRPRED